MKHFLYFRLHEAGPGPEHLLHHGRGLGPLQRQEAGLAAGVRGPGPHAALPRPDHGDTRHVAAGTRVLGWRAAGLLKLSGLCWLLLPWPLDRCTQLLQAPPTKTETSMFVWYRHRDMMLLCYLYLPLLIISLDLFNVCIKG